MFDWFKSKKKPALRVVSEDEQPTEIFHDAALKNFYQKKFGQAMLANAAWRWKNAKLDEKRRDDAMAAANKIIRNMGTYEKVGHPFEIPAWVIGVIHYRESSFNFHTWLANGDSLEGKTWHVPIGLGPAKNWIEGAVISLNHEGWRNGMDWDLPSALLHIEAYNGFGYRKRGVVSPYVWAGTSIYHSGKYTSDGHYDPRHVDHQLGCAAIALCLKDLGIHLNEREV